ncbi:MAG TPA: endopeptidase La [Verrucomicrobiae bacterium]|nr:endopeptidase La [Verrucomicrobiae bacterium]
MAAGGDLERFPLLPLRDIVVFPHMVVPLFVGREKSIAALDAAMTGDRTIFLATQKDAKTEDPQEKEIYSTGTLSHIVQLLKLPDGTVKVLLEGKRRGVIRSFIPGAEHLTAEVETVPEGTAVTATIEALVRSVKNTFENYVKLTKVVAAEALAGILEIADAGKLADSIAVHLNVKIAEKQELLAIVDAAQRMERLYSLMEREIEVLQIEKKIQTRVKKQMERTQKEYYLNEQMRAIQKELGGKDEFKQELNDLEEQVKKRKLSPEAEKKALGEIKKLKMMSPMSAEAAVVRNYVDWLVSLPWGKNSKEKIDIVAAAETLEREHYGLEKVKERILEYLSVLSMVKKIRGPILCLAGPPGVGKTSLARSIATATGRKFVKMSLGGVRDEAEIRGHRRTYVGAMPGKIIQNIKKAGVNNPLFLLDEIDKMSSDFRGDPGSALLEVLDPEQNRIFNDHFLDIDYDLSRVMFVTTANSLHTIPRPLLDRMEVIHISGYTENEKLSISRRHLFPKQLEIHGLAPEKVSITDDAILEVIRRYTREAGVRNLEREMANLCRKITHRIARGALTEAVISRDMVRELLGVPRYRYGVAEEKDAIGTVTGLAWTEVGGELLNVEVSVLPGKGKLLITGKLGDVMQESAQAAMTYVRSRAQVLGLDRDFYQNLDIHIHVPEGAIPKDGPSAGITMATALTSALTRRQVRRDVAMTGEITLRGRVLAIGGLKEKILAAKRGMIGDVIIPAENEKDLADVPAEILEGMNIHPVSHMDQVVELAFVGESPLVDQQALPADSPAALAEGAVTAH